MDPVSVQELLKPYKSDVRNAILVGLILSGLPKAPIGQTVPTLYANGERPTGREIFDIKYRQEVKQFLTQVSQSIPLPVNFVLEMTIAGFEYLVDTGGYRYISLFFLNRVAMNDPDIRKNYEEEWNHLLVFLDDIFFERTSERTSEGYHIKTPEEAQVARTDQGLIREFKNRMRELFGNVYDSDEQTKIWNAFFFYIEFYAEGAKLKSLPGILSGDDVSGYLDYLFDWIDFTDDFLPEDFSFGASADDVMDILRRYVCVR